MKGKTYAIQITRRHLDLVTLLNDKIIPGPSLQTGKYWLVIKLEEDGNGSKNHEIVHERELFNTHELIGSCPFIIRVKK
jgi:hypothetical protein